MRVGMGYDVHRLQEGCKLIMGGVEIPYEKGLLGHSDADVLLHAIMDALLGAAALGDIGKHFPDTDPQYKGISSIKLLEHVAALLDENGYVVENIDATIIAQRPKMRPYSRSDSNSPAFRAKRFRECRYTGIPEAYCPRCARRGWRGRSSRCRESAWTPAWRGRSGRRSLRRGRSHRPCRRRCV